MAFNPVSDGIRAPHHVLAVPCPSQGHINPMLRFCKRLSSCYGLKTTLATTLFISNTFHPTPSPSIAFDTISDGFDDSGFSHAASVADYLSRMEAAGSKTLAELITRHNNTSNPIDCVIYDAFLPWALDLPVSSFPIAVDGLRLLSRLEDMPSFIGVEGSYPASFEMVLSQFTNAHEADFLLFSSVYELEEESGCFFTHCGWNSMVEALSLGVPMVAIPLWTDQTTNAKLIENLWKVGVRVKVGDEDGNIVERKEIEFCIREVLEGDRATEMRKHAKKCRNLAVQAIISEGRSSDNNIREFISKLKFKHSGNN
ncbi:hypothetical protein TIFTF001_005791 [Ficus carica]|uniref:Uncharacterized protein n=1 Tax=Ficus carica TaxID=3494 RepID=A0AA87ZFW3_FICCA|nr:hypothetical protein TIFTF001_005791 [Ficus carica]